MPIKENANIGKHTYNSVISSNSFIGNDSRLEVSTGCLMSEVGYFKGRLSVFQEKNKAKMFISNDENSLFYRVPCDMLSFLDGCPSKVTQIKIDYNEDTERVTLCASYCEDKDERARFTVGVGIERLF